MGFTIPSQRGAFWGQYSSTSSSTYSPAWIYFRFPAVTEWLLAPPLSLLSSTSLITCRGLPILAQQAQSCTRRRTSCNQVGWTKLPTCSTKIASCRLWSLVLWCLGPVIRSTAMSTEGAYKFWYHYCYRQPGLISFTAVDNAWALIPGKTQC